ncbi:kinase-like domain-containing protein [Gigaspora rosea]|uniref:Kinase-like domain-containing protein n=1 Tax=Gigaspora rosea TaxID=44941 RepID=A0A397W0K5_9GLOM|nr:kinase-like domain-containing protein [Gigaspora rosea]
MEISSKEIGGRKWLEKAISDEHIKFFDYSEFNGKEKINDSVTSFIYKSEWTTCGLIVALKSIKLDIEGKDMESFAKELQLLQKVWFHPKINPFYGVTKDPSECYMMILQFANGGNLREFLNEKFSKLQWEEKYRIAGELAEGLSFLHNNNIIHRNLHPKNILVHDNKIMISDFCLSKLMTSDSSSSNSIIEGMPSFIDPQCFKDPTYKRTTKSDIYSYGVVLWEISSGHKPFPNLRRIQIAVQINTGKREKPIDGTPQKYVELYTKCWDDDPAKRPEMEEIIKFFDPYIVKPINTPVNTQNPLGELIEEAISEKTINFYNYDEFDDHHKVIVEEEFSSVYESKWKPRELIITLKYLQVHNKSFDKKIVKQLKFLQNAVHPNIVKFYGITKDPSSNYYVMIMKSVDGGCLRDYLMKNFSKLQWSRQLVVAIEIAEGLEYLHKNDISHLDLNSKIILVCKEEKMVIAGFGIPERANKASFSTSIVRGMAAYIEPQCLKDQYYERDMRSDIYSLGVILWEISSGKPPYKSFQDEYQTLFHVNEGGREKPVDGTNPEYVELYKLCWDEDPAKRPDIKSVLETLKRLNKID